MYRLTGRTPERHPITDAAATRLDATLASPTRCPGPVIDRQPSTHGPPRPGAQVGAKLPGRCCHQAFSHGVVDLRHRRGGVQPQGPTHLVSVDVADPTKHALVQQDVAHGIGRSHQSGHQPHDCLQVGVDPTQVRSQVSQRRTVSVHVGCRPGTDLRGREAQRLPLVDIETAPQQVGGTWPPVPGAHQLPRPSHLQVGVHHQPPGACDEQVLTPRPHPLNPFARTRPKALQPGGLKPRQFPTDECRGEARSRLVQSVTLRHPNRLPATATRATSVVTNWRPPYALDALRVPLRPARGPT
jgi:hypothetical protein